MSCFHRLHLDVGYFPGGILKNRPAELQQPRHICLFNFGFNLIRKNFT